MILRWLTSGLIIGLLIGCSKSNQDTKVELASGQKEIIRQNNTQKKTVAEAAKLTPEQVEALQPLNDANNPNIPNFKILVPTYLPPGFKINKFEPSYDRNTKIGFDYSRGYTIEYKNLKSNVCFHISGYGHSTGGGGDPGDYKTVEVCSPALGKVVLIYTEFSQYRQNSYIEFENDFIFVGTHAYEFTSSSSDECGIISVKEAVKIVESFQWLNY